MIPIRFAHTPITIFRSNIIRAEGGGRSDAAAFSLTADIGYEKRGDPTPNGWMGGLSLANRVWWTPIWATTLRGDVFYDQRAAVIQHLPLGDPYQLPSNGPYLLGGVSITQDVQPIPWIFFGSSTRTANRINPTSAVTAASPGRAGFKGRSARPSFPIWKSATTV